LRSVARPRRRHCDQQSKHSLSARQIELILDGGVVNFFKRRL
jgi:hypothetical protein